MLKFAYRSPCQSRFKLFFKLCRLQISLPSKCRVNFNFYSKISSKWCAVKVLNFKRATTSSWPKRVCFVKKTCASSVLNILWCEASTHVVMVPASNVPAVYNTSHALSAARTSNLSSLASNTYSLFKFAPVSAIINPCITIDQCTERENVC